MGRPGVFKYFNDASRAIDPPAEKVGYVNSIISTVPEIVSSFHIDGNGIIYAVVAHYYDCIYIKNSGISVENQYDACYKLIEDVIMYMILVIAKPKYLVTINFDGVCPVAKMQHQKQSRYKSGLLISQNSKFDYNQVTPGSTFMIMLNMYFESKIEIISQTIRTELGKYVKVIYSSPFVRGEGEHKMIRRLPEVINDLKSYRGAHLIYGPDADIIFLSLNLEIENIHILSRYVLKYFAVSRPDFHEIEDEYNKSKMQRVINISLLKNGIVQNIGRENCIKDFVFIVSFIGNDFVPYPPSMNNVPISMDAIMKFLRFNTDNILLEYGTINWNAFLKLLEFFVNGDTDKKIPSDIDRIIEYNKTIKSTEAPWKPYAVAKETTGFLGKETFRKNFRSSWYSNSLSLKFTKFEDYSDLGGDIIYDICKEFLKSIIWTSEYYNNYDAVTWMWYYPYHYSPMLSDVLDVLHHIIDNKNLNILHHPNNIREFKMNPLHQLCAVMPPVSKRAMIKPLHWMFESNSPVADLQPQSFIVDEDGKEPHPNNLWYHRYYRIEKRSSFKPKYTSKCVRVFSPKLDGIAIIPFVQPMRIIDTVSQLSLTDQEENMFAFANDISIGDFSDAPILQEQVIEEKKEQKMERSHKWESDRGSFRGRGYRGGRRGRGRR